MKIKLSLILLFAIIISDLSTSACTTFIISGRCTPDGKPVLFKHRDTDVMDNALVYFKDGKYDYIGLVTCDKTWKDMVWGGYNSTGFAIINSAAYNNNVGDTSKLIDREGILIKLALQRCKTLNDFERMLDSLPKPMGVDANFGVIDAFGGAAYYETGNYRYVKYDVNDPKIAPKGFLVRTNHSYSGDLEKGLGFCRYNTALAAMNEAADSKHLDPEYLFNHISRNLTHSLTKTNLRENIPSGNENDFRFFIDYIPRRISSAAVMIVGAADEKQSGNVVMWTILGFPLTSVAVPVWIAGGEKLPAVVSMKQNLHAPLCDAALKMKEKCFPLTRDGGQNYINLAAVINSDKTGYMQLLQPLEQTIFHRAKALMRSGEKGETLKSDIQSFYSWLDSYLAESYFDNLGIKLFE